MQVTYELSDTPEGTQVEIHAVGTPGRYFGWATQLMRLQVQRSISADLARLRTCLEK